MKLDSGAAAKAMVAICIAAIFAACGRQSAGVLPSPASDLSSATGSRSAASFSRPSPSPPPTLAQILANLIKARQLTSSTCSFTANGNVLGGISFVPNSNAWINSPMSASGAPITAYQQVTLYMTNATVKLSYFDGTSTSISVPDSMVTLSPTALTASVSYNDSDGAWEETIPMGYPGNFFMDGVQFAVPAGLKLYKSATWTATISSDTAGVSVDWGWSAVSYNTSFGDYNSMGVKPMDSSTATVYPNSDAAGTPENYKNNLALGPKNAKGPSFLWTGLDAPFTYKLTPCQLGSPGAGPSPSPSASPAPPGSTPAPTPSPGPPTPTPSPVAQPSHAAYITNQGDNTVSVIDTTAHRVVQTIAVGNSPYGVSVNPSGTIVYIGNEADHTISAINTATGQVTSTIPLAAVNGYSQVPYGLAFAPSGSTAYVATNDGIYGGAVGVIAANSNSETSEFSAPSYSTSFPYSVLVNPAGTTLYVGDLANPSVNVVNTANNAYVTTVALSGGAANGMAINSTGTNLYVCDGGGLSYVSTVTNTETAFQTFNGNGCGSVALNAAGTTAYVSNNAGNTVSLVNTTTRAVTATVNVGQTPEGISVSPAGTEVYVANEGSNSVSVISTTSNAVTFTIAVGSSPFAFGNFLR